MLWKRKITDIRKENNSWLINAIWEYRRAPPDIAEWSYSMCWVQHKDSPLSMINEGNTKLMDGWMYIEAIGSEKKQRKMSEEDILFIDCDSYFWILIMQWLSRANHLLTWLTALVICLFDALNLLFIQRLVQTSKQVGGEQIDFWFDQCGFFLLN